MSTSLSRMHLIRAFAVTFVLASPAHALELVIPGQVMVVNMIHPNQGSETSRDSEPNLAVNPNDPLRMAASAFTPALSGESKAPIYISTDGGRMWALNHVVPFNDATTGTGDITLRFGTKSGVLYIAALKKELPYRYLRIFRARNFTTLDPLEPLNAPGEYNWEADQPYVQAISVPVAGDTTVDRVYVAFSDTTNAKSAAIYYSWNAAALSTSAPDARFVRAGIERSTSCLGDPSSVPIGSRHGGPARVAVHGDGTVYGVFMRYTAGCNTSLRTADIVVVRDDNWGARTTSSSGEDVAAPNAFTALMDPGDTSGVTANRTIAAGVSIPYTSPPDNPRLGRQRIGEQISIAIDPSNSQRVYVAWGQRTTDGSYGIQVSSSTDRGKTWTARRTITSATNPSVAISSTGKVGFLYQQLVTDPSCSATEKCWVTHLERSNDDFTSTPSDLALHKGVDDRDGADPAGPIGDYNHLMAIDTDFYGIFSGNNNPDIAKYFPQGRMPYGRKAESPPEFATARLLANDGTEVPFSVDPFFFHVSEPIVLDRCFKRPWLCDFSPKMERGLIKLKCLMQGCTVIDLLPRNCPVKFNCPGCARGGMCPPYYHLHLDGLSGAWRLGLLDSEGMPVAHRQFKTRRGIVVSFRPSKGKFIAGQIGSYLLAFEMRSNGKVGTEYRVKARLARSDRHFEVDYKRPKIN